MIVDCAHYKDGVRQQEGPLDLEQASTCVKGDGDFVWLGLLDPSHDELADVQRRFGLHDLAIEDAESAHQRPKLEDYEGHYFVVLRTAHYDQEREEVEFGEIHVFLGPTYVIVIRHGTATCSARRASGSRGGRSCSPRARLRDLGDPRLGRRRLLARRRGDRR